MGYVSQGIATRKFGIVFRSKLEAVWAEWFAAKFDDWAYVDSPWHDFVADGLQVEVKPAGMDFLLSAISRAWKFKHDWLEHRMLFVMGEPDVAAICLAQSMDCGQCLLLSFQAEGMPKIENRYVWHHTDGVYGHYCEHGTFHRYQLTHCDHTER